MARTVPINQHNTVSYAESVMNTVVILYSRYALLGLDHHMFVMDVQLLVNVP
mgnify:CR=1 FL=1